MNKWLGTIGAVMMFLYEVIPGSWIWQTGAPEMTAADDFSLCYPVAETMRDGRTFSIYLPVQPDKKQQAAAAPYVSLGEYEAAADGYQIRILHGVLETAAPAPRFDLAGFRQAFPQAAGSFDVQGEGIRLAGNKPLHIIEGVDGNDRKECLGFQAGRDVWLFYFQCAKDDEEAKAAIERAVESIAIN